MLKLLKGSFIRLFSSSEFQIMPFILVIANAVVMCTQRAMTDKAYGLTEYNALFHFTLIGICVSVFTALFIGTEYSNATVFNKIIFGHSRAAVYFTYLLTCLFAAVFFELTATAASVFIGWALVGKPLFTVGTLIIHLLLSLPSVFAMVSLHLAIAVLLQNRAVSIGASAFISTALLYCSMFLCTDKYFPNELLDLLPDFYLYKIMQAQWLISDGIIEKLNFPLYPCLLFIVFTALGLTIFSNINIRNTPEGEV